MSVHRCPDCTTHNIEECRICLGSRYVHRNSWGRITHPATPKEFFDAVAPTPKPYGKPTKFPRFGR